MALIPIDVALGGINSIRGLFGANEADRERRRQLEQAAARVMAARVATTEGLLKEQAARLAAQQQFENERYARLSDVNQRRFEEAQGRGSFATEFAREGMAMPGNNLQTYLGNLVSMMPKAEKPKPKATAGYNPPAPSQAPFGSQMNWQKDVSEVTDIPLSGIINTLRYAR